MTKSIFYFVRKFDFLIEYNDISIIPIQKMLPHDCLLCIFEVTDRNTLSRCSSINRKYYSLLSSDTIWKPFLQSTFKNACVSSDYKLNYRKFILFLHNMKEKMMHLINLWVD
jgi:hypothetical protein